jgi:anti-sigma regulatory factor (Ser/Thr protein kinase)
VTGSFRHEALLCRGHEARTDATLAFLRSGMHDGAATTMVAAGQRTQEIARALGPDAHHVHFETIEHLGSNPAHLIPFWMKQLQASSTTGQLLRGVSEALPSSGSADLVTEFGVNESLINIAFGGGPSWTLLCPYDVDAHEAETIRVVRETHPFISENGVSERNAAYRPPAPLAGMLPTPPGNVEARSFSVGDLRGLRRAASALAREAGLLDRADDVALVVSEVAANSVRYGGGEGRFSSWRTTSGLICEVRDSGVIVDPLVGRVKPYDEPGRAGGAGLWIANSLSDLVQIRSGTSGTNVRLHFDYADR